MVEKNQRLGASLSSSSIFGIIKLIIVTSRCGTSAIAAMFQTGNAVNLKYIYIYIYIYKEPIPVAARSACLLAEIAGSNLAGFLDICLL